MARMSNRVEAKPKVIDKFYGINEAVGETEIKTGEWVKGFNFRVTKNMKPQKRPGHHTFIDFESAGNAQGIYEGVIDGKNIMLVAWNGNVYEYDRSVAVSNTLISELITIGVVTIIGTLTDVKTNIFWFQGLIYFMTGVEFKQYDGTTFQDVVPYIPTIALNSPPAGGGTLFEEINLLTGQKTQTFIGDGASTLYQLAESTLDVDTVLISVDGVAKTEGVDFTVDRTLGQVTFGVAPVNEASVLITWVKVISGNSDLIINNRFSLGYGTDDGSNLFIYGNVNQSNVYRFSGIKKANYFPANSLIEAGTDEFAITALKAQYKQLIVFKENESKLVRPTSNPNFSTNTGLNPYNYGYEDLNDSVGNIAENMVQLIENSPLTLSGFNMWKWSSATSVEDERNAKIISDRLKLSLQGLNLALAVTLNYKNQTEYWVNIDDVVYIWNYGNDTMYKYNNIKATEFIEVMNDIYYTSDGTVEHINESFLADGETLGTSIPCKIYGGFTDFGTLEWRKIMRDEWFTIASAPRTSCKIGFVTDKVNEDTVTFTEVDYKTLNFDDINFDDWSFNTNLNPQPQRIRSKVKKWTYLQWIFENDSNNETLTILKLLLKVQTQGHSK